MLNPYSETKKQHAHITYCLLDLLVFAWLFASIFTSFREKTVFYVRAVFLKRLMTEKNHHTHMQFVMP